MVTRMTNTHTNLTTSLPSKPIPLVFIFEELNFGGTQRQMLEVACRINRSFFAPEIWTLREGRDFLHVTQNANIPVHFLRKDETLKPLPAAIALLKYMRLRKPPILHLCTTFPNVWGRIWGRLLNIPVIVASVRAQGNVNNQYERFLWRLAHMHICNASSIKKDLLQKGIPQDRLYNILNGVDTDFFAPQANNVSANSSIVCVGRLVDAKDHTTLLRAFQIVEQRLPGTHLHILGRGELRSQLEDLSRSLNVEHAVTFEGTRDNVHEFFQKSQLFVLSSIDEGTPNVLLEAMSCAMPVVATAIDGIPDVVEHNKHGLLVPARDPASLAESICLMLEHKEKAKLMGQAGRRHMIEHYSLDAMTKQHESIYISLCKNAGLLA